MITISMITSVSMANLSSFLQLPYTWNVESNNGIAMKKPELDIPESGWVPSHVQMFRLKLPCTGVVSAEVRVMLNINITAMNPKHSNVSLIFLRNKICLKTIDMLLDSVNGKNNNYYNYGNSGVFIFGLLSCSTINLSSSLFPTKI